MLNTKHTELEQLRAFLLPHVKRKLAQVSCLINEHVDVMVWTECTELDGAAAGPPATACQAEPVTYGRMFLPSVVHVAT